METLAMVDSVVSKLGTVIETLFPSGVVTVRATAEMYDAPLFPEEEAAVQRAVEKRRREYAAGRAAARAALAKLGFAPAPIAAGDDRSPEWPPGVVGSISHTRGCCAVAVARAESYAGVGLDVESGEPMKVELSRMICTPGELERLARLPKMSVASGHVDWAKVTFSAKEAFYKCYHPLVRVFLGFQDVELELDPESRRFTAAIVNAEKPALEGRRVLQGNLQWDDGGLVYAGIVLERF
jgi:4'-phosphopantetheinyl transferase EntD